MEEDIVYIGKKYAWGGEQPFGLNCADRRHHAYIIGKTGSGKTTLLRNLIVQDIEAGRGVGVIDPHGDLAEELLDCIPPWRTDDVVYFNPADLEYPIGFNVLEGVPPDRRHLVASGVVSAFKHIWADSWGPRLEYIFYNALAALLDAGDSTLLGVVRLLADEGYRARVVRRITDPLVRAFWLDEFEQYDERFRREAIAPIQNKVGQFLANAPLRNMLGQVRSAIDLRFMMDRQRIFIANLSKGRLGEDKSNLLGALLVAGFQLAAMGRADVPEEERADFFLFIDEFQNFSTSSFASILAEARKYRLNLTLSHQYLKQLRDEVKEAVLGNVGTMVAFCVGHGDAAVLEQEFGQTYAAHHFSDLRRREVCVRLLVDGETREPFTGKTFPPLSQPYGRRANIIRRSREKYGTRRQVIEDKVRRWMGDRA